MSTIIQIKRTTTANLPTTLEQGELSYIYDTSSTDTDAGGNGGRIYIGDPTSNSNTPIKIGGKSYTDLMEHSHGTLTASAALLVDSNKKINELLVDNITIDGNAITSTNTNGNITITPAGTGKSVIGNLYVGDDSTSLQEYIQEQTGGAITAGEGIDVAYNDSAGTTTITGEDATVTNKGIASFATADFGVSSGAVSLSDTVVKAISTDDGALTVASHGFSILGGEGMDVNHSGTAITVKGDDGTVTNKGIASFATADFGVSSGAVSLSDTVVKTVTSDSGAMTPSSHGFSILGGEGMDVTHSGTTITVAGEDATVTNKGVASFATADFAVTSGAVTIKALGVANGQIAADAVNGDKIADNAIDSEHITNGSVDNVHLSGSIANAKLANDGITIGSTDTSLGDTITALTAMTQIDVDNLTLNGNTLSSSDTNGDVNLTPNGTGTVVVPSGYEGRAGFTSQSLVNKTYVDQVANGLDVKASVRVATTANLASNYNNSAGTLTASSNGAIAIDGVTLVLNNRVLVKDQTTATQNGFYKVTTVGSGSAAFVLTRTPDANEASEITGGAFTFVEEGTANADNGYVATHNGTPTLGTDNITFDQFSGAGQISAGAALSKNGNTIDVEVDDSSIQVSGDALQVKALGITNGMLAGSIANAKLSNSSVTINSTALALGGSLTLDTGDFAENGNLFYTDERVDDRIEQLFQAGEGIDLTYNDSSNTFTVDAELSTASNRGVASFASANFTVSSGAVTVTGIDGGTYS